MAVRQKQNPITPAQYLELEEQSEFKNEYFKGEIFAMVGATKNHNWINANIARELGNQLKDTACMGFSSDQRVKIQALDKYVYPDIVVACENMEFLADELDSLVNPVVIMEILSESTESYDRGLKFEHYQCIESLQEYLLVSQDRCRMEKFKRDKNSTWIYTSYTGRKQVVVLASVRCELPLSEIYHRVEFNR